MWNIDRTVGTGDASTTIQWVDALEGTTFSALGNASIGISRNNGVLPGCPPLQTSADDTANTVTATFNTFSPFGVGDIGGSTAR